MGKTSLPINGENPVANAGSIEERDLGHFTCCLWPNHSTLLLNQMDPLIKAATLSFDSFSFVYTLDNYGDFKSNDLYTAD